MKRILYLSVAFGALALTTTPVLAEDGEGQTPGINATHGSTVTSTNTATNTNTTTATDSSSWADNSNNSDSSGVGSANNGGTATYTYTTMTTPSNLAATVTGGEAYLNNWAPGGSGGSGSGAGSGDHSGGSGGTGGNGGAGAGSQLMGWDAEFDNGAFSNFAGLNAMNVNTGFFASQNASVNVSASVGTLTLTP